MKTIKRICMTLIIMMLSVTMLLGTLSFSALALSTTANEVFADGINIVSEVKYGGKLTVPAASNSASVKVIAPNGETVATAAGDVDINQVGTYTVSYSVTVDDKEYSYDFDVISRVDEEYSIYVEYGGADIPTVVAKDTKKTLPAARLVYYDEDGVQHVAENAPVKVKATMPEFGEKDANGESEVTFDQTGKVILTYYAALGENGKKIYTKDFEVRVQETFDDATYPKVNVRGVPKTASLNNKVTLPVGEGSDDDDKNVKVEIEVKDPKGNKVTEVDINEDGFAYKEDGKTYAELKFDNDKLMSFYPTVSGKYVVTYTAKDDADKSSATHRYEITVSDTSAPVFEKIDEHMIPANWGLTVKGKSGSNPDSKIRFPMPTIVDNCGSEGLEVRFEVTDPDGKNVIDIPNLLEKTTFNGNTSKYGNSDSEEYDFNDKFFDFNLVKTSDTLTGDYKVQYTAKDKNNNRSYKTYTINVVDEFTDDEDPVGVKIKDAPEYLLIAPDSDKFEVPATDASDKNDSRPEIVYTLKSAAETDADKVLNVTGGETLEIVEEEDGSVNLVNDKDEKLAIAANNDLTLTLTVTDKLGNSASDTATVKVFSYKTANAFTLSTAGIKYDNSAPAFDGATDNSFVTNRTAALGSFEIGNVGADFRDFTGYELSIKNPNDGNYVTEVSSEYYYDVNTNKIVVRNIEFKPEQVGKYQLSIRAFDLSGRNIVSVALIDVKEGPKNSDGTVSTVLPNTGKINATYQFRQASLDNLPSLPTGSQYYMLHSIKGSIHSVMGSQFTAKTAGSYYIVDGYAVYNGTSVGELETKHDGASYTVSFDDEEKPVIEIQDTMPTYVATKEKVTLPSIIAFNNYASGTVTVNVRHAKKNTPVSVDYDEATRTFSFTPVTDGEHTITVTGTLNNQSTTAQFTLYVGDVKGPEFSLKTSHAKNMTSGKEFTFSAIEITPEDHEKLSEIEVVKTIYDPSGAEVSEATIKGKADSAAAKTKKDSNTNIKLTKSGTYTVVYTVTDAVGNSTEQKFEITVSGKTSTSPFSIAAVSTVLIVVGVVLIVAVILYFVLFRKRKAKN